MRFVAILEDRTTYAEDLMQCIELVDPTLQVTWFRKVDEAIIAIVEDGYSADAWIIDLMLPKGSLLRAEETDNDLATGERFILEFFDLGASNLPWIFICSARSSLTFLPNEHSRFEYMPKADVSGFEIAKRVCKVLEE